ncbi:penton base [Fowl aviadenovirus 1]|uniref:Penton protein n=2 Tax=Fowl aviadenovirus A TaxID=190061 RepID=CAPSP_ADEG1|nr:penton base [Fowl aviadenovirus A]AP_000414.1 III [Fowl aviadenovirus A]Q64755.1 RecName: Full=Penton protein; Short=CP-P; AltName: Full=Penton base protein; AltName: Full=Protein III [Fowl aviadenovirus 1]AAC54908.1 penton base [Fowl aviadenovirus 1]QGQ63299.1 penton base [Fowl aviadenovirus A]
MYRSLRPPTSIPPPPPSGPSPYPAMINGYPPDVPVGSPANGDAELFVPLQRVMPPTGGRNSIRYRNYAPCQNTTKFFYVDNKLSDLDTYNEDANHSNFRTTVIHNQDLDPSTAATETIQLDNRSCWGGELKTAVKTNCPNISSFFQSDTVRVRLMSKRDPGGTDPDAGVNNPPGAEYKWYDLRIPEGNYALNEIIDLLNEGIVQLYLQEGRQNNVLKSDIGVKFDTRYLDLLKDPVTGLVTPGTYVYKGYHPDIILLPGCAVDFTFSRLSLLLGIAKREPYSKGFTITYEDLQGGNVPALLDLSSVQVDDQDEDVIVVADARPLLKDSKGVSYNVITTGVTQPQTAYRSWLLAYHTLDSPARNKTLLTVPDMAGGIGAMYTSMPDTFTAPAGFKEDNTTNLCPVVAMNLFPSFNKVFYQGASAYVQRLENATQSATAAFNRFPENEILKQAPPMNVSSVCDNQPAVVQQGVLPLKNSLSGLQRVLITDDRRRPIPYVYKTIATVQPRVLSSSTLQ